MGIHNITISDTGEQAIEKMKQGSDYDLILLDFKLPGLSGIEVIKMVKRINPSIAIIMITGLGSEKIAVKAMKLGIQDYITKEDFFNENMGKIITSVLYQTQFSQETALTNRLVKNPNQLSVTLFKFGQIGPQPFLTTLLPFEDSFINEQKKEEFLLKIGTHYMAATGTGHDYAQGLYELPVPDHDKYHSLVFGFRMADKQHSDNRIHLNDSLNYGLVVIIFPLLYRSILPNRSLIERRIQELLSIYSDMAEFDSYLLPKIRNIFLTTHLLK